MQVAVGWTAQLPTEDRYGFGFEELLARLCVCMAGRVAERLLFGEGAVSTGASSDINAATQLAFKMVASWGMSRELGPLSYSGTARSAFISSETARQIELEVRRPHRSLPSARADAWPRGCERSLDAHAGMGAPVCLRRSRRSSPTPRNAPREFFAVIAEPCCA